MACLRLSDRLLDREFHVAIGEVLETMPNGLLRVYTPIRDDTEIMLRVAGMLYCNNADGDVELFMRALRSCVAKEASFEPTSPRRQRSSTSQQPTSRRTGPKAASRARRSTSRSCAASSSPSGSISRSTALRPIGAGRSQRASGASVQSTTCTTICTRSLRTGCSRYQRIHWSRPFRGQPSLSIHRSR